jgi:hypothetical protein
LLFGHARVKHNLQQEIAEFVSEVLKVATRDRVSDFISFLDGVGRNGREILLEVPRAAGGWRSKCSHDFEQA